MTGRIDTMPFEKLLNIILDEKANTPKAREMAKNEIMRREKAFRKEIEASLRKIEEDERLGYPTATIDINAPLALIQCALQHQVRALKYVLIVLDAKDGEK